MAAQYISVIVPAAGSGKRMTDKGNKLLLPLAGKPIIQHTLEHLLKCKRVDQIILVIQPVDEVAMQQVVSALKGNARISIVYGADSRSGSVKNALAAVNASSDIVLVHDGARPFVSDDLVNSVLDALKTSSAVIPAVPVVDTIKQIDHQRVLKTLKRDQLVAVQTPQGFRRELFEQMVNHTPQTSYTDDASIAEALGQCVLVVAGDQQNFKITRPHDLDYAQYLMMTKENKQWELALVMTYTAL